MRRSIHKINQRLFSSVILRIDALRADTQAASNETNTLVRELIIEERQRAEATRQFGGVMRVSDTEIATRLFNGAIMYLNPSDIAVVPHIVFESVWERQITKAWLMFLQRDRNMTVLDIGANFGYFGMLAAQHLDKQKGRVFLFEPNSKLIPYIQKNLSVNWLNENSTVVNAAVSDQNGSATLNVLEDYIGSSSMHSIDKLDSYLSHKMHISAEEKMTVKTVTIDSFCADHKKKEVDLIKMDIEGFEDKAYIGMRSTILRSKRVTMFIEFTRDGYDDPEGFYNSMLKDFGNVYLINDDGTLYSPKNNSYKAVAERENDWVMLVFSKLDKKQIAVR